MRMLNQSDLILINALRLSMLGRCDFGGGGGGLLIYQEVSIIFLINRIESMGSEPHELCESLLITRACLVLLESFDR